MNPFLLLGILALGFYLYRFLTPNSKQVRSPRVLVYRVEWNPQEPTTYWLRKRDSRPVIQEKPLRFNLISQPPVLRKRAEKLNLEALVGRIPKVLLLDLFRGMMKKTGMSPRDLFLLLCEECSDDIVILFCHLQMQANKQNWEVIRGTGGEPNIPAHAVKMLQKVQSFAAAV